MAIGKITRVVPGGGWGFIQEAGRRVELFFYRSAVRGFEFAAIRKGQAVQFDVMPDPRDRTRQLATNVRLAPPTAS